MPHNLLISGGSSDIGRALISCLNNYNDLNIFATTHSGNLNDLLPPDKILSVDFSDELSFNNLLGVVKSLSITHFIQLHGVADIDDSLVDFDLTRYEKLMRINLERTLCLISNILPMMIEKEYGRIVVVSTASAKHGGGHDSFTYGITKHALLYLTEHMGKHYSKYNILTNCILPGFIDTKFHSRYMKKEPDVLTERAKSIPLKRAGTPEEVAKLIINLIIDNTFVSGQSIKVDGGDFI